MNIICFKRLLGKELQHAYTKTTYQNQWSYKSKQPKIKYISQNFDLSYDQRCRKKQTKFKTKKQQTTYFWETWWRYTLLFIGFLHYPFGAGFRNHPQYLQLLQLNGIGAPRRSLQGCHIGGIFLEAQKKSILMSYRQQITHQLAKSSLTLSSLQHYSASPNLHIWQESTCQTKDTLKF